MASQPELPLFDAPKSPFPVTFSELPPTVPDVPSHAAHATIAPSALQLRILLDEIEERESRDDVDEVRWSLRAALERTSPPASTRARFVELLRFRGEHVEHVVLRHGDKRGRVELKHSGRALVDGVELGDDGARFDDDDGANVLVRWASRPQLVWTAALLAEEKMARKLHAIASACGAGVLAVVGALAWIAQYRENVVVSHVDDEWVDMTIPQPHFPDPPEPKPEPKLDVRPDDSPKTASAKSADRKLTRADKPPAKLDFMSTLSKIPSTTNALQDAVNHIQPVAAAHADVKVSTWIPRGPRDTGLIGGHGESFQTGVAQSTLAHSGGLEHGDVGSRDVRGNVTALPRQLKLDGGALSPDDVRRVVDQHIGEIQFCYEKQLTKQAGIAGRVLVEWTVKPDGSVSMSRAAEATLSSPAAVQCMLDRVKTWKFPRPQGGSVTVRYPFVFAAVGG
jgi:hypothetical protein